MQKLTAPRAVTKPLLVYKSEFLRKCRDQTSGFIGVFGCDDWDLNYHCAIPAYEFTDAKIANISYKNKDLGIGAFNKRPVSISLNSHARKT